MPGRPRRVTQRVIAEIAGVSQTTVSMVLNDRDGRTCGSRRPPGPGSSRRSSRPPTSPIRWRGAWPGWTTRSSASSPTSRPCRRRAGLLRPVPDRHRGAGREARLRPAAASPARRWRTAAVASSTKTTGCAWPTAASCSAADRSAPSWSGSSPSEFPFVAVGRRDDAGGRRCRTSAPTTSPPTAALIDRASSRSATGRLLYRAGRGRESPADRMSGFRPPSESRLGGPGGSAFLLVGADADRRPGSAGRSPAGATVIFAEDAILPTAWSDARARGAGCRGAGRPLGRRARRACRRASRRRSDADFRFPHPPRADRPPRRSTC